MPTAIKRKTARKTRYAPWATPEAVRILKDAVAETADTEPKRTAPVPIRGGSKWAS